MLRRYLLLNFNTIHTHSNWLCWKAQEKFLVDSRFCTRIDCSYVTLLTTYPAKKTMFKVSNRNTRKRCLLISKITLKASEQRHLTTSYLLEVTVLNHVLDIFPRVYTNLQSSLLSVLLSSSISTIVDPYMFFFREMKNHCRKIIAMKNSNVSIFY